MYTKIKEEATVEPVSLTEVKLHLRVDHTSDDVLITGLIKSVREWCESYERRAYCIRSYQSKMTGFGTVELPNPPLVQVDSVKYIDTAGDTQTLASTYYDVDTVSEPGIVYLAYNQSWPSPRPEHHNVEINYTAGYMTAFTADDSTDVITVDHVVFADGDEVRLITDQNDLPAGLSEDTTYYVRDVSSSTLKLAATTGGAAIDITDAGTGTHLIGHKTIPSRVRNAIKLIVGYLYENRGDGTVKTEMPDFAKNLLCDRNYTV